MEPGSVRKTGRRSGLWADIGFPLAVFLVALSVRLLYLFQIESIPLFYYLGGDARVYDEWAQRIASGDWLGREVFYQAPLYPYFLALLQSVFGHDLWTIRIIQAILGALSCSLLYWVGKSFFSPEAGVVAGFILALYAPAIFYGGLIQKAVLSLFLTLVLLLFLGRAQLHPRWHGWLFAGLTLALLALTRENALVWLFVLPLWIWLRFTDRAPRIRLRWLGVFFLGAALMLLPVGLRNLFVGGDFALTTSQLGPNFYIGNNPTADGTYGPLRAGRGSPQYERQDATELAEKALGRPLSPNEVSRYWMRRSWDHIRSEPLDWLGLMAKKWLLVWNVREVEDYDDFYLYQHWSWLLKGLAWTNHFGVLASLAAIGCFLTWRTRRRLSLLYLLLMTFALSVALIYVFGRYRFPMVVFLSLFAGAGLIEGYKALKEGRRRDVFVAVALALATAIMAHWPVAGWPGPSASGYLNLGSSLAKQGRSDEAVEYLRQAVALDEHFAEAHYDLAIVLTIREDLSGAIRHFQRALEIDPAYAKAHAALAIALASRGELDEAIEHFRAAIRIEPQFVEAHEGLGRALALQGKRDEAVSHYEEAIRILQSRAKSASLNR